MRWPTDNLKGEPDPAPEPDHDPVTREQGPDEVSGTKLDTAPYGKSPDAGHQIGDSESPR